MSVNNNDNFECPCGFKTADKIEYLDHMENVADERCIV